MNAELLPPGPRGNLISGHLPEYRRDALGFLTSLAREYGDFASFPLGTKRCILVNQPAGIEKVLVTNHRNFIKPYPLRPNRLVLGNSLASSEGDLWLRQRRLMQPAFHKDRIAVHGEVMI